MTTHPLDDLPNIDRERFRVPDAASLGIQMDSEHARASCCSRARCEAATSAVWRWRKPRDCSEALTDRYSERKESAEQLSARVNQRAI
ncbi:hypothetical protein SAMN04487956_12438 [Halomonas saccharevitans]|uniref:Uncharacterized protein n=1 Tax=Halomonas saccharevitans TaxID=416872 RepID=A0A1I7BAC0_9GAMM|nr:hypothetical protein [Halomonas saccharevitans]SFT84123.1 hypothetical protein SAMN04487956_12438 [Halomonas saccharevitans]